MSWPYYKMQSQKYAAHHALQVVLSRAFRHLRLATGLLVFVDRSDPVAPLPADPAQLKELEDRRRRALDMASRARAKHAGGGRGSAASADKDDEAELDGFMVSSVITMMAMGCSVRD